ncbi:hypothetical protein ACFLSX_02355 [Calditrichota bacterium]
MLHINLILALTIAAILFRYVLAWIWDFDLPDSNMVIVMISLAVGLKFGEDKGKKLKELLFKLRDKFRKKKKS